MSDLELLEKYEPVLRFAKSERFFPMRVEPYLELCKIFPSGPKGAVETISHLNEALVDHIGELQSEQFYLRFVNNPLRDFDAWIWWCIASVLGVGTAWWVGGLTGVELAVSTSLLAALVIFMIASPIRLRIIPAALAAFLFIGLEIAPVWFFLHPNRNVGIAVEYLVLLPIYLLVLFYLSVRTMKFILDRVIPEVLAL